MAVASVQLFVERGERTGVQLETAVLPEVARICHFLEGIPLALELAASWVDRLAVATIYDVIVSNLNQLCTQMGDVPLRHRSMRSVFEVSWGLLGKGEQHVLVRLSAFQGGFRGEAAISIVAATPASLQALLQASLIRHEETGRYTIHELLRQFAGEKWGQLEAEAPIQQAHSRYFLTWLADQEAGLNGPEPQKVTAVLRQDLANIRQAWQWAVAFQMAAEIKAAVYSLVAYLEIEGLLSEGQQMLENAIQTLRSTQEAGSLPRLLIGQSKLLSRMGRYGQAEQRLQEALPLALRQEEALDIGHGYLTWSSVTLHRGDYQRAVHYAREVLALAESESLPSLKATSLTMLAQAQMHLGEKEAVVEPLFRQALALFEALGDRRQIARALNMLAGLTSKAGRYNQARRYWRQALDMLVAVGERAAASAMLNNLGGSYAHLGSFDRARSYYQQSCQWAIEAGLDIRNMYSGLAYLELMAGNVARAEEYGRQALQGVHEAGLLLSEVHTLVEFGPVLLAQEKWSEAVEVYQRVLHLSQTLGEHYLIADAMTGLAQAALSQGQLADALHWVETMLVQDGEETLAGAYDSYMAYLICYRVLKAHDDPRAKEILAVANGRLQDLLADLEEELRPGFLSHPVNQALLTAQPRGLETRKLSS
jgi:tetratricopeptide (TPR) repeat protein